MGSLSLFIMGVVSVHMFALNLYINVGVLVQSVDTKAKSIILMVTIQIYYCETDIYKLNISMLPGSHHKYRLFS